MENYNEIKEALKPRNEIYASDNLRCRINKMLKSKPTQWYKRLLVWALSTASAAALACLILIPSKLTAQELLTSALEAFKTEQNFAMEIDVRTAPADDFEYIDIKAPFVTHKINVSKSDSTINWRVDKKGRIACGFNNNTYVWLTAYNFGWKFPENDSSVLNYLKIFLSPSQIIEAELNSVFRDGANYELNRYEDEIHLKIHSKAQGNFKSPYMLNKSIAESENIRYYTFDADSKSLKTASYRIMNENHEIEILRISKIYYGSTTDNIYHISNDIRFDLQECKGGFPELEAEELTIKILSSFKDWDTSVINQVMTPLESEVFYKDYYQGTELMTVGQSFKSGTHKTLTFVPYELKLHNGSIKRGNIALYRQPDGAWLLTGGI